METNGTNGTTGSGPDEGDGGVWESCWRAADADAARAKAAAGADAVVFALLVQARAVDALRETLLVVATRKQLREQMEGMSSHLAATERAVDEWRARYGRMEVGALGLARVVADARAALDAHGLHGPALLAGNEVARVAGEAPELGARLRAAGLL